MEKAGLRLWLHDCLHTSKTSQAFQNNPLHPAKVQAVSCDCLDDFAMPMTEVDSLPIPAPATQPFIVQPACYNSPVYAAQIYSGLLRAPPASML